MRQILRFYKRYDLDLLALRIQGISLPRLGKIALEAYAHGKRPVIVLPAGEQLNMDTLQNTLQKQKRILTTGQKNEVFSFKCEFTTHDPKAENVLKNVKNMYRNQFIKTLIRNMLAEQSLTPFFVSKDYINNENDYLGSLDRMDISDRIDIPMSNSKVNVYDYLKAPKNTEETQKTQPKTVTKAPAIQKPSQILEEKTKKASEVKETPVITSNEAKKVPVYETITDEEPFMDQPAISAIEEVSYEQEMSEANSTDIDEEETMSMFADLFDQATM